MDNKSFKSIYAISDIHVNHRGNENLLKKLKSENHEDWLILAGDVCERSDVLIETLEYLTKSFEKIIWVPGNHELYTTAKEPIQIYGEQKYEYMVNECRKIGVVTPEDEYPIWEGSGQSVQLIPMMLLYDYTFLPYGEKDSKIALENARKKNVFATDEFLINPIPYSNMESWSKTRIEYTENRLNNLDQSIPKIFINHWPTIRRPVDLVTENYFSLWCGTTKTENWHNKYNVICEVFGHLHIPHTSWVDGVRFEEVSYGYPREINFRGSPEPLLRKIMPIFPNDIQKNGTEKYFGSKINFKNPEFIKYRKLVNSRRNGR